MLTAIMLAENPRGPNPKASLLKSIISVADKPFEFRTAWGS